MQSAIHKGNVVHDHIFGGEGINLDVPQALNILRPTPYGNLTAGTPANVWLSNLNNQLADPSMLLEQQLASLCQAGRRTAAILISQNAYTIVFLSSESRLLVADSHAHGDNGAMLAIGSPAEIVSVLQQTNVIGNYSVLTEVSLSLAGAPNAV